MRLLTGPQWAGVMGVLCAATMVAAPPVVQADTSRCGDTDLYAEKGGNYAPGHAKNTMPNFDASLDAGFDGIETDVRPTADLDLVIFHDQMLNGKTDGRGYVDERTTAYVRSVFYEGTTDRIELYTDVLDMLASRPGKLAVIEIKPSVHWTPDLFADALIQPAVDRGVLGRIIFDTAKNAYLPVVEDVNPAAETAVKGAKSRDGLQVRQIADSVVTGAKYPLAYVQQIQNAGGHAVLTSPDQEGWQIGLPKNPDGLATANAIQLMNWCTR